VALVWRQHTDDGCGTVRVNMTGRPYGQFCGLARALELIGERWSVLVIRDLLLSPKRFSDLQHTLPRIQHSILASRLSELEIAGVIQRRPAAASDSAALYELTPYGRDLEPILLDLGIWGARSLGDPGPEDAFSVDIAILALHAAFRPELAQGIHLSFELRFGELVINARVDDGALAVREGGVAEADLVIDTFLIKQLMSGELDPTEALWNGYVQAMGDPALLSTFVRLFHIPAAPAPVTGLSVR
jgi:DNA-binding HxlR family transcriptional regulator